MIFEKHLLTILQNPVISLLLYSLLYRAATSLVHIKPASYSFCLGLIEFNVVLCAEGIDFLHSI